MGGERGVCADNGMRVYITSRSEAQVTRAAAEISASATARAAGGVCVALAHDLSTEAGCLAFASALREREEALDVLVNNAGTAWGASLEEYPDHAWDKVFNLNVKAVFSVTRALLPLLDAAAAPDAPSRVINIGSIVGITPQPVPTYAYDASKAAVHLLTRKLAAEFADRPGGKSITVNAIAPGFVPSRMSNQLLTYASKEAMASGVPLGRLGTPEDMAGAALFLASRAGAWVTGAIVTVDGGSIAQPFSMLPKL